MVRTRDQYIHKWEQNLNLADLHTRQAVKLRPHFYAGKATPKGL